jgi:hypothetical protein
MSKKKKRRKETFVTVTPLDPEAYIHASSNPRRTPLVLGNESTHLGATEHGSSQSWQNSTPIDILLLQKPDTAGLGDSEGSVSVTLKILTLRANRGPNRGPMGF